MHGKTCLNLQTNYGMVVIPFVGLKELDLFTVGFENEKKLVDGLSEILDLSLKIDDVYDIYITCDKYQNTVNSSLSCIKYKRDNFNFSSLKESLSTYFKQDPNRIKKCEIRHVETDAMVKFNDGYPISDDDIDLAVKVFFKMGYKQQRDMYFMIRDFGNVRIDRLSSESSVNKTDLSKIVSKGDDYLQYLIELASRNENSFILAMDNLSKVDLEEIIKVLGYVDSGVVDSITKDTSLLDEDRYVLEIMTGFSIVKLKEMQTSYKKNAGLGR